MITITIPIHNTSRYIDCCISSVVNQSYRDIEIILVDDGSTDGSQDICDAWATKDSRIKVVHQENKGLYMARKVGASKASGEYVLPLDSDDWLELDTCEKIAKLAAETSADVIQYGVQMESDSPKGSDVLFYENWFNGTEEYLSGSEDILTACYVKRIIPWNIATKAIRTSIINKAYECIGDNRINQLEDYLTSYCVFLYCKTWSRIKDRLYHYRFGTGMSTTSMIMSLDEFRKMQGYAVAYRKLREYILNNYPHHNVACSIIENEMKSYIDEEYRIQLERHHFSPKCQKNKNASIEVYKAILDTVANYECATNKKIAVHLHLFYIDMIPQIANALDNIPISFDLFVSIPESIECEEEEISEKFSRVVNVKKIVISKVPNRGRDIAPMLCTFKENLMQYDMMLHLHTKKSPHDEKLDGWFSFICRHLLPHNYTATILNLLESDGCMVAPPNYIQDPSSDGWGKDNINIAQQIINSSSLDINLKKDYPIIDYPQGTMFWARTDCLKPLFDIPFSYEMFPKEPIGVDGTIAHALERLFFIWGNRRKKRIFKAYFSEDIRYERLLDDVTKYQRKSDKHLKVARVFMYISGVLAFLTIILSILLAL